jgi:hypothetical protein
MLETMKIDIDYRKPNGFDDDCVYPVYHLCKECQAKREACMKAEAEEHKNSKCVGRLEVNEDGFLVWHNND